MVDQTTREANNILREKCLEIRELLIPLELGLTLTKNMNFEGKIILVYTGEV